MPKIKELKNFYVIYVCVGLWQNNNIERRE